MNQNLIETDEILEKRIKNISKSRKYQYKIVFKKINELSNLTPTQLLEIAKKDQNRVVKGEDGEWYNIFIEDRTISTIQDMYYGYLETQNLAESSKQNYLLTYRSFFPKTIELPEMPIFNLKKKRLRDGEIPSYDDVEKAVNLAQKTMEKLIILTPAVSGLRISDFLKIKFNMILEGTKIYHDGSWENFLEQDPSQMIACFETDPIKTQKQGNLCITFFPPWWMELLFLLIEERKMIVSKAKKELNLLKNNKSISKTEIIRLEKVVKKYTTTPDSYIFLGNTSSHITQNSIVKKFQRMNHKLGGKKDRNNKYGKFRSHNLRKLFSTTCRRNIGSVEVQNKNPSASFSLLDAVSIMTGHVPPNMSNSEVYDGVEEDNPDSYLRQIYTGLLPYLTNDTTEFDLKEEKEKTSKLEGKNTQLEMELDFKNRKIEETDNKLNNLMERQNNLENLILNDLDPKKIEKIRKII